MPDSNYDQIRQVYIDIDFFRELYSREMQTQTENYFQNNPIQFHPNVLNHIRISSQYEKL